MDNNKNDSNVLLNEMISELSQVVAVEDRVVLPEENVLEQSSLWLKYRDVNQVKQLLQEISNRFLGYLKNAYEQEGELLQEEQATGNIAKVMNLMVEATDKFDSYCKAFGHEHPVSVKESDSCKQLFHFYERKIAPIVTGRALLDVVRLFSPKAVVDGVKAKDKEMPAVELLSKDSAYELLFMHEKRGGKRFASQLLRAVKAAKQLEKVSPQEVAEAIKSVKHEEDMYVRDLSSELLIKSWKEIDDFTHEVHHNADNELVQLLYHSIVALMLASQEHELASYPHEKRPTAYFSDFQHFLRQMFASYDFQKMMCYPSKSATTMNYKIVTVVLHLMHQLFMGHHSMKESLPYLEGLMQKAGEEHSFEPFHHAHEPLTATLGKDYEAIQAATKPMSSMPLVKILENFTTRDCHGFDPFYFRELPGALFSLGKKGHEIEMIKMPSPTVQEYVHEAKITDEFFVFLRSLKQENKQILLFNLQDRTQAGHFARSFIIEDLETTREFGDTITVVSMTKEGEFYTQTGVYEKITHAKTFIDAVLQQFSSENAGYHFSEELKKALFSGWVSSLCHAIHGLFFESKNSLTKIEKCDFIELVYLFMQLKIMELVGPAVVSFTCKDGLDVGIPHGMELYMLLKMLNERPFSHEEEEMLRVFLFAAPLFTRGRTLLSSRFMRLQSTVKCLENVIEDDREQFHIRSEILLNPLFKENLLKWPLSM